MNKREEQLFSDLQEVETVLIQLEQSVDIWQNKVIKMLTRAVYHILIYLIRNIKEKH